MSSVIARNVAKLFFKSISLPKNVEVVCHTSRRIFFSEKGDIISETHETDCSNGIIFKAGTYYLPKRNNCFLFVKKSTILGHITGTTGFSLSYITGTITTGATVYSTQRQGKGLLKISHLRKRNRVIRNGCRLYFFGGDKKIRAEE